MRTILQTHVSRVFESETKSATPTFWESLSPEERKGSVDQQRSWEFKSQYAWDPAGRVMEEWNASIYPNLLKPLFKDHTARLFRGAKKQCWYSITCWMVGDEWLLSHPAAIVISGDPKVTRNGVRLVEKHGQLSQFGYRVYEYESKILPSMAASLLGELNLTTRLCDMPITVGSDGTSARRATLGGVIILGEKYFGVTVLHPFIREDQTNPSTDDDHSALSDSDGEASSIDVNLQYGDIALDADTVYLQNSHSLMEYVGAIPRVSKSKYFSQHLDWALVELKSTPDLLLNFTIADGKVVVLSKVSTTLPRNLILTAMNPAAPIQAKVAPIIHGLFLPHSGLQDAWALNMKPRPGDSGTWVVDPQTESIFGIIVAGSELTHTSYVLPAQYVFNEIRERFPNMQFPLSGDLHTLLRAIDLKMPQIAELAVSRSTSMQLNSVGQEGWSPLSLASAKGLSDLVSSLLQAGADPNLACSPSTLEPLHLAAYGGFVEVMRVLLDFGVSPHSRSVLQGQTPFHFTRRKGHVEATELLLERRATINSSPNTSLAMQAGFQAARKLLLDCKVDSNTVSKIAVKTKFEAIIWSILINKAGHNQKLNFAVHARSERAAQLLIDYAMDPNKALGTEMQPNFETVIKSSLEGAENPDQVLDSAAWAEYESIIPSLLNGKEGSNQTRDSAVWTEFETAIRLLFKYKVHSKEVYHFRAQKKYDKTIRLLHTHGVAFHKEVHVYLWARIDEFIQLLLDRGADPKLALFSAIGSGDRETIKLLLDRGADPDEKIGLNPSPLEAARNSGHDEIIDLLISYSGTAKLEKAHPRGGGSTKYSQSSNPFSGSSADSRPNVNPKALARSRTARDLRSMGAWSGQPDQSSLAEREDVYVGDIYLGLNRNRDS